MPRAHVAILSWRISVLATVLGLSLEEDGANAWDA